MKKRGVTVRVKIETYTLSGECIDVKSEVLGVFKKTMAELLEKDAIDEIKKIKQADIVVGIPSFENQATIEGVVKAAAEGLIKYFPELKPVIVNSDGASTDKTREIVKNTSVPKEVNKIVTCYKGVSGKGSALRTIFEVADMLEAKICITIDADSRSITPEWIERMAKPIYLYSYGFVSPYYLRDKHDGTITNALVYPLTRALYGLRVRQPIGGDFALTAGLVQAVLRQRVWNYDTDVKRFGIDVWLTTTAINEGFRTCQASLGVKIHDPKNPLFDVTPMFKQVCGTMFGLMRKYENKWKIVRGTMPAKIFGGFYYLELEEVSVGLENLVKKFKEGAKKYQTMWKEILAEANYAELEQVTRLTADGFQFPVELWAKIIYDYATAYNFPLHDREKILESLLPLYFGRTAAFVIETNAVSEELADAIVEGVAGIFERLKPYLVTRWNEIKRERLKNKR